MTSPLGIDLNQYKTQAKELLKAGRAAQPHALARFQQHHPEAPQLAGSAMRLADAQLVIARENGFSSWKKFKEYLVFGNAVKAFDAGDEQQLARLLDENPSLVQYQCHVGALYETGYFAGATLLHHVAGNPDRGPLPRNVLDVARLLISRGIDREAAEQTIGLLLTSKRASEAGVALPLIDLLVNAGARFDLDGPEIVSMPLLNLAPETAVALVRRGAKMDLRHAAALGDIAALQRMLSTRTERGIVDPAMVEEALCYASIRGQREAASVLVGIGAKGDILVTPGGQSPRTALHEAANRGHVEIVTMLLEHGARAGVVEPRWGGTAADWAEHGGHADLAVLIKRRLRGKDQG